MLDSILKKHQQHTNFFCWCSVNRDFAMCTVVEGKVTIHSTVSLWHLLEALVQTFQSHFSNSRNLGHKGCVNISRQLKLVLFSMFPLST